VKLLIDTHILLWAAGRLDLLPAAARTLMGDADATLLFSVVSIWEVAIKSVQKRDDFLANPMVLRRSLLDNGYAELPIIGAHAVAVAALPPIHKDPFDRLLIAQAIVEGMLLLTSDRVIAQYPAPVQLV
jgi:PIN domain nuclease of toxin-antitoxin system